MVIDFVAFSISEGRKYGNIGLSKTKQLEGLECVLADVAAIAGGDAGALGRGLPPAAVGAAEGGHGGVAAAVHDLLERQVGVVQQVVGHLHVPMHAQLDERQSRELLDSGRELRVRMAAMAGGFCAQGTRYQAVHDRVEHLDARQLPRRFHRHHLVGQTPFVKTALLGEGGHVQPLKRPLRDGLFRCRHSQSLLFVKKLRSRPRRRPFFV